MTTANCYRWFLITTANKYVKYLHKVIFYFIIIHVGNYAPFTYCISVFINIVIVELNRYTKSSKIKKKNKKNMPFLNNNIIFIFIKKKLHKYILFFYFDGFKPFHKKVLGKYYFYYYESFVFPMNPHQPPVF